MLASILAYMQQIEVPISALWDPDMVIATVPFLMYSALLVKLFFVWRNVRACDRRPEARLAAILLLITVCTLTFMAANAYMLAVYGKTLLSMRVFQMFVLSNCMAYWLVLDLITKDARENKSPVV